MSKILVTGASGHLGRAIIRNLLETYNVAPSDIVAATRDPAKLSDLAAKGIEIRKADFDDAASLPAAFAGIERLLIISTDALHIPGIRIVQHAAAVEAAVKAGVKHLLYTSMLEPDDSLVSFANEHLASEQAVIASGIPYSIFRNGWYMENYFLGLPHALSDGKWYTSAGEGRVANISRNDCASSIAAVLSAATAKTATYNLTGPKAQTTEDVAALVRDVTGRPLAVVQISDEQLAGGLKAAGLPDFIIPALVSFDANTREGKVDFVTTDVETLTGKKPQDLKNFLEENKAALTA
jgi:NAD(P)H dehydrogenase (quinone)